MRIRVLLLVLLVELVVVFPRCDDSCKALQHLTAAEDLQEQGLRDEAIVEYDQSIRLDSTNPVAYRARGFAHFISRRHDSAIQDYSVATRLEPEDFKAYFGRALAYANLGQHGRALDDYAVANTLRSQRKP